MILLNRIIKEEDGQGLVEYSLILAFMALVIVVLGPFIRNELLYIWGKVIEVLNG